MVLKDSDETKHLNRAWHCRGIKSLFLSCLSCLHISSDISHHFLLMDLPWLPSTLRIMSQFFVASKSFGSCSFSLVDATLCIPADKGHLHSRERLLIACTSSFFVVVRFELRASCLLGRYSPTSATPPSLFCDGFFQDRVWRAIYPGLASNCNPPDLCLLSS
jgi:hypothetical protein